MRVATFERIRPEGIVRSALGAALLLGCVLAPGSAQAAGPKEGGSPPALLLEVRLPVPVPLPTGTLLGSGTPVGGGGAPQLVVGMDFGALRLALGGGVGGSWMESGDTQWGARIDLVAGYDLYRFGGARAAVYAEVGGGVVTPSSPTGYFASGVRYQLAPGLKAGIEAGAGFEEAVQPDRATGPASRFTLRLYGALTLSLSIPLGGQP